MQFVTHELSHKMGASIVYLIGDMNQTTTTDEELMTEYAIHDDFSSFEMIYQRYSGKVFGYLMKRIHHREWSEEIHQGVFLKLHLVKNQYQSHYPFAPWFFTIVRTVMVDHLRKIKSQDSKLQYLEPEKMDQIPEPEVTSLPDLEPLKQTLSPEERKAIELRYEKEWSFEEMAKNLELNEASVRKRISRALQKMRKSR